MGWWEIIKIIRFQIKQYAIFSSFCHKIQENPRILEKLPPWNKKDLAWSSSSNFQLKICRFEILFHGGIFWEIWKNLYNSSTTICDFTCTLIFKRAVGECRGLVVVRQNKDAKVIFFSSELIRIPRCHNFFLMLCSSMFLS